jgi:hypothetical protein
MTDDRTQRVAALIQAYDQQGYHRTGTATDTESARWLAEQVHAAGHEPLLTSVPLTRVVPLRSELRVVERSVEGLPLFDGTFTDTDGVSGRLGGVHSGMEIGVGHLPPYWRWPGAAEFEAARRSGRFRAMVAVCDGTRLGIRPGLTVLNAEQFRDPFGPPVLQVPTDTAAWLGEAVREGTEATVIAEVERRPVEAFNVQARVEGVEPSAPLVIMTPRSGWWQCASERGGGLACWVEMLRAFSKVKPRCDVWFLASTGHELGHIGLERFIEAHKALVQGARAWIHLGADFAAAVGPSVRLQASDAELEGLAAEIMGKAGVKPDVRTAIGARPRGEANNIREGGGRYVSVVSTNGLFHHPEDRWPDAVDLKKTVRFAEAFVELGLRLAT